MEVTTKEGIHSGFFQPWAQVNSWNYFRHPWLLGDELKPVFKDYDRLRYRLLPYIYSCAHVSNRTGMPIMRALPLEFPDDAATFELLNEYMLGPAFLIVAFNMETYLPEGTWIDYWTGERHVGPKRMTYAPPSNRGGGAFVRAGSVVPMWPVMDYVGQRAVDEITLDVYPGDSGSFVLYEDDGATYAYEDGDVAATVLDYSEDGAQRALRIGPREGSYDGMPPERAWLVQLHVEGEPDGVVKNDVPLEQRPPSQFVEGRDEGWAYDPSSRLLWIRPQTSLSDGCELVVRSL